MTEFVLAYRCGAAPDSNRVPFSGRTVTSSHQRNIKILALEQGRQGETVDPQPCGYYSPKPPKCSIAHKPIGALPRVRPHSMATTATVRLPSDPCSSATFTLQNLHECRVFILKFNPPPSRPTIVPDRRRTDHHRRPSTTSAACSRVAVITKCRDGGLHTVR